MSAERNDPAVAWAQLRIGNKLPGPQGLPTRTAVDLGERGVARYALDGAGCPRVLLPLAPREAAPRLDLGSSLKIGELAMMERGANTRYVEVVCKEPALEQVFADVIQEILDRITTGVNTATACATTAEEFSRLFLRDSSLKIDKARIMGLVGELLCLNALLAVNPASWRTWVGGDGNRNDFRCSDHGVEVKTTAGGAMSASIASLQQLEVAPKGSLLFLLYRLDPTQNGSITIQTLVLQALDRCSNRLELRKRLAEIGCIDSSAAEWNDTSFEHVCTYGWFVNDCFPRVVAGVFAGGSVPLGVSRMTYEIDLSHVSNSALSGDGLQDAIGRFASLVSPE